jgi:DNA-binding response OmpR family regulator
MQSKRILVVEDDPAIREGLEAVLCEEGYHMLAASTAESALAMLYMGTRPDVILLDLVLPGVGGFGFLEEWKANSKIQSIPIVVMSAHCDPQGVSQMLGLAGSVQKPFRVEALLATLADAERV